MARQPRPGWASRVANRSRAGARRAPADDLRGTPAERVVSVLVLEGRSNAAIARARGVSVPTVATQVSSVFQKLGTCGRTEHVALLLRDDLKPARGAASWSIARPFARLLGVSRMTLITKMKRHGIKQDENGNGDDFDEDDGDDSDVAPCTLTVSVTLRPLRESAPRSTPWPPPSRGSPRRTRSVSVRRR